MRSKLHSFRKCKSNFMLSYVVKNFDEACMKKNEEETLGIKGNIKKIVFRDIRGEKHNVAS